MPKPNNFRVDRKELITEGPLLGRYQAIISFDCADCGRPSKWSVALWDDEIPYVTADIRSAWKCFRCDGTPFIAKNVPQRDAGV
jgi:hypothetical protein